MGRILGHERAYTRSYPKMRESQWQFQRTGNYSLERKTRCRLKNGPWDILSLKSAWWALAAVVTAGWACLPADPLNRQPAWSARHSIWASPCWILPVSMGRNRRWVQRSKAGGVTR